jgi:hypothetical protein
VLWNAAKDVPDLASYNKSEELLKHSFFKTASSFKPHKIIQISQHLKEGKRFLQIMQDQAIEMANRKDIDSRSSITDSLANDTRFCSTTNMTLRRVKSKFESQIRIFYLLC